MRGREFKDAMYDGLARLMKALANPARLEIIEMLSQGEKSVEGVAEFKDAIYDEKISDRICFTCDFYDQ